MQNIVRWQSPSNIAIVKYWGKYGRQYPRNTSLSLTLSKSVSRTQLMFSPKTKPTKEVLLNFIFEGNENEKFRSKAVRFLSSVSDLFPFLLDYEFIVESSNTFPHSSGIASSASGMSALALCLLDAKSMIETGNLHEINDHFLQQASFLARLGSGSACRSVYPYMSLWGQHDNIVNSSQDFGIPWRDIDPIFKTFHDDILIVSKSEKSVSSTAGHNLMEANVYANSRYQQAQDRIIELTSYLRSGEVHAFGKLAEDEALTLHALMMCSNPSYILMEPGSLDIIQKVRNYRKDTGLPVYFSLDAGPNIHLLYPDEVKGKINDFIKSELLVHCENQTIIEDMVGLGPVRDFV